MAGRKQPLDFSGISTGPVDGSFRFEHFAMATTFEIIAAGVEKTYAGQAAAEAFEELDRLEADLSRYVENSDISRVNAAGSQRPVAVGEAAFECLGLAVEMRERTGGAFDVTAGHLKDRWVGSDGSGMAAKADKSGEPGAGGCDLVLLDEAGHTVRLAPGVKVDLGGIGKGFAIDRTASLLRQWEVNAALIHGGFSSVLALDPPPEMSGWPVTMSDPRRPKRILSRLSLCRRAIGGSGLEKGPHIIDPATGGPAAGRIAAWAVAGNAGVADALSTAFMIMPPEQIDAYCRRNRDAAAVVVTADGVLRWGKLDRP
jgi:thiamine biosynthesis lipoprotein